MGLSTVEEVVQEIKDGKFVIVVDDEDRENEGDLVIAAEKITAEVKNTCHGADDKSGGGNDIGMHLAAGQQGA